MARSMIDPIAPVPTTAWPILVPTAGSTPVMPLAWSAVALLHPYAPLPSTGKRFVAVDLGAGEPLWRADNEIAVGTYDAAGQYCDRVALAPGQERPLGAARRWITLKDFRDTPGPSVSITPDGRIVYLQGAREQPLRFLRVVPSWTTQVRAAVDSAEQRR
jgi:hypothetical protein